MKTLELNPEQFPKLSRWNQEHLDQTLENLSRKANPSKTEITLVDKMWAATMLEMDLQTQSGSIWSEIKQEEPRLTHNKMMFEKMKKENIPWAEY